MNRTWSGPMVAAALALALAVAARRTEAARKPSSYDQSVPPRSAVDTGRVGYAEADLRFVQGMIAHHAQALAMTSLLQTRTSRDDMRLLARRIEVSQRDEIAMMKRWLADRHETLPDTAGEHEHMAGMSHEMVMPGMLSPEDMARLSAASGAEFDRLFLTDMIRHHEGAIIMVKQLFATRGAGQEPQLFGFATDVDVDQRAEIARMRAMLAK